MPDRDGKSKLDRVEDMLTQIVQRKPLPFHAVQMDTWYATKDLMLFIDSLHKIYCCPHKDNRQVDDSGEEAPYRRVDEVAWNKHDWAYGKLIKIKGFPKDHKVKLLRVAVATSRTGWVVANDLAQDTYNAVQEVSDLARQTQQTVYRIQHGLLDNYLGQQLKHPSVKMCFASFRFSGRTRVSPGAPMILSLRALPLTQTRGSQFWSWIEQYGVLEVVR